MNPCWGGDCSWLSSDPAACSRLVGKKEVPSPGCGGPSCHLSWQHCVSCPFQSSARPPGSPPDPRGWRQPLGSVTNEVFSFFLAEEKSPREKTTPEKVFRAQIFLLLA